MVEKNPYYKIIHNEDEVFLKAFQHKLPLMIKGPTGCGKSRFVEHMAAKLGRPLIQVACHDDTSATDLIGRYLVKGGDTLWQDGPLTRAVREGAIIYLDEIAEAREDVVVVLHPLTDHRREIFIDRKNESLKAPSEFMLIVSFNPGYQRGLKELKPSTRQRFLGLSFNYPEARIESEIIEKETGCDSNVAKKLVVFASKIRGMQELGLTTSASTRLLINAAYLIKSGFSPREACITAITQPLTDDSLILDSLRDMANLIF